MSSKELPAPAGAEQTSVFSVFGFRNKHPADDGLDTPLEAPSSHGDSTTPMEKSVLSDLRHMRRKQMREMEEQKCSQIPPEPARKLNSNLQEQTKVTTQTILNQQDKTSQPRGALQNFARRYSRPQVSSADETFDANALIQRFNSSFSFPSNKQNSSSDEHINSDPDPNVLQRYFGRRRSSPDVATLSQLRSANLQLATKIKSETLVESSAEDQQMAKTLDKSASYSDLPSAMVPKDTKATGPLVMNDSVDAMSSTLSDSSSRSGFGILSTTRKFGAWLTRATEGEKMEVTKKDLNAFAPTSF